MHGDARVPRDLGRDSLRSHVHLDKEETAFPRLGIFNQPAVFAYSSVAKVTEQRIDISTY